MKMTHSAVRQPKFSRQLSGLSGINDLISEHIELFNTESISHRIVD